MSDDNARTFDKTPTASLDKLAETSPVAITKIDRNGRIVYANSEAEEVLGLEKPEITNRTYDDVDWKITYYDGTDYPSEKLPFEIVKDTEEPVEKIRHAIEWPNGERKLLSINASPLFDDEGDFDGMVSVIEDVTEQIALEKREDHLTSLLESIKDVNQLLVKEDDKEELIEGICDILIETRDYYNVWVALLDEDKKLITASQKGLGDSFKPMQERLEDGNLPETTQKALDQPGVVVTTDPRANCDDCPLSDNYEDEGALTARLAYQGKVYGVISASTLYQYAVDEEEQGLFEEVAGDIGFGLHDIEVENDLKKREAQLKRSQQLAKVGSWRLDLETGRLDWSEETCRIFEVSTKDSLSYEEFLGFIHPEDRDYIDEEWNEALENDKEYEVEYRIVVDGGTKWVKEKAEVARNQQGKPREVIGSVQDITERREMERKYQIVTEGSSHAISLFQDGEFKFVNERFEQLTGYSKEELKDIDYPELIHPDYREKVAGWRRQALSGEDSVLPDKVEYEGLKKDGEAIWLRSIPSLTEYKGMNAIVINTVDITEEKEREAVSEKYETLFEYAYDAILFSHFETGRIFEANPEAENLLGYGTEELMGKKLPDLFTDGDFPQLKEQLEGGRFFYREDQPLTKKDGSRIVASMSSSLIEFQGKKTILALLHDMTRRIELEEELRSRAQSLKESNEKLEEIIHIISHDLKEPLRSIGTYSDMLFTKYRNDLTDTSFKRLEDIKEGATRLKNMLDEVSNLAQVTTDVSPEPIKVPELIEEVKGELGLDLTQAEIKVDSDFPRVEFDKFQLKVLLKNLISNGLKYNEAPKQVEVGYNLEPEDSKLAVLVRDNGEGIAKEHQQRVFRMFEQLEPDRYSRGTGAGLALCKRIIEGNNEEIWLDSDPGVGTAVGFTVPIHEKGGEAGDFISRLSSSPERLTDSQKSRSGVIDEESGLYDRNYFDKVLADRLRKYCESGNEVRFLVVGLPSYQEFKEERGAEQLDRIRIQLSTQLKNSIRQSDLILRFSEKLFLLILPNAETEMEKVKSRIDAQISEWNDNSELLDHPVELSYGSASLSPSGLCDPVKALKEAEEDVNTA